MLYMFDRVLNFTEPINGMFCNVELAHNLKLEKQKQGILQPSRRISGLNTK